MNQTDPRPEAVDSAAAWLTEHRATYGTGPLNAQLREGGYSDAEVEAAWARVLGEGATTAAAPPRGDLRARAASITIVSFLGTFAVLSYFLLNPRVDYASYGSAAVMVLGALLVPIGLLSLLGIANSGRLKRGAEGALVAVLAIPFVMLVIVAGLCVVTTNGLNI
jgi:hypothetical protein